MRNLNQYLFLAISASFLISCSATKGTTNDTEVGVRPKIRMTDRSIINASGDGLTPSIGPAMNRGAGSNNSVSISNSAIDRAKADATDQMIKIGIITDEDFMYKVAINILLDNNISNVALEKSNLDNIKAFSKSLISNNNQIQADLKKLSADSKIKIPDGNDPNVKIMQSMIEKNNVSKNAKGSFDARYVQMMISDHQSIIRVFEAGAKSKNEDIAAFSTKYLPVLQANLAAAQDLTKSVSPTATDK